MGKRRGHLPTCGALLCASGFALSGCAYDYSAFSSGSTGSTRAAGGGGAGGSVGGSGGSVGGNGASGGVGGGPTGGVGGAPCGEPEQLCADLQDNDCDGNIDCDDTDCSGAVTCNADAYVDDDAAPGGDGTIAAPFNDVADAIAICDGTPKVIVLFPGTYPGLTLPAHCSIYGAGIEQTIVDATNNARGITIADGGTPGLTVSSLSVVNGLANDGGGVAIRGGRAMLESLEVRSSHATNRGGGLRIDGGANVTLTDVALASNIADLTGGGLHTKDATVSATNLQVVGSSAVGVGGNLYIEGGAVEVYRGQFSDGTALRGGGVYVQGGSVVLSRVRISGNAAATSGGGVYLEAGDTSIENTFIVDNQSGTSGAGLESAGTGTLNMNHVTIAGNIAVISPGGIHCPTAVGSLQHIVIWGNQPSGTDNCSLLNSNAQVQIDTTTAVDPLFVDANAGDYHIQSTSPMIDSGQAASSLPEDFDGDPRSDGMPDKGADER